jgi:hypothetical protein
MRCDPQVFQTAQLALTDFTKPELQPPAIQVLQTLCVGVTVTLILAGSALHQGSALGHSHSHSHGAWSLLVVAC